MDTKITRSQDLGIRASDKNVDNNEKLNFLCFFMLDMDHEQYKSCLLHAPKIVSVTRFGH